MGVEERVASPRAGSRPLTFVVAGILATIAVLYFARWGHRYGLDLRVYRAGIASWRHGHNPYEELFTAHHLRFTYPPFSLIALSPLSWAPFAIAQIFLWVISLGALTLSTHLIWRHGAGFGGRTLMARSLGWAALAAVAIEPVRSTLNYGQINLVLMGLVVTDVLVVPKHRRGYLIGLAAAIKLTPLIFLALPLLERDWRTVGRGLLTALGATGITWLLSPKVAMKYWSGDVIAARRAGNVAYAGNQSIYGMLHRWPFPSGGQTALWTVLCVIMVGLGLYVASRCLAEGRRVAALLALAFTGLLISPISWTHHWVWVAAIPPVLGADRAHVAWRSVRAMLWLLLAISVIAPYWWFTSGPGLDALGDSLTLTAMATIVTWSWSEFQGSRRGVVRFLSTSTTN